MRVLWVFLLMASFIAMVGCLHAANTQEMPVGKGLLNPCISDPTRADYWQGNDDTLWSIPEDAGETNQREIVARVPSCENLSVTIWEYRPGTVEWVRVTLRTNDGRAFNGWLDAHHLIYASNETGTEWSMNYSSIVGRWTQTGRGNGAKIWYDFNEDGTFTFNYDMRGNGDPTQERGIWTYLGNMSYDLNPEFTGDLRRILISNDGEGRSFVSGTEYSSGSGIGRDLVYRKE
jgi:hypothetical protein